MIFAFRFFQAYKFYSVEILGYWQFNLGGVKVNGKSVASSGSAIVDTGTSLIAAPSSALDAIANTLGAEFDPTQGLVSFEE